MDGFTIENGVLTHYTGEEKHVIVPDGVTEIGEYAFFMCENLEVVVIPKSVLYMDLYIFLDCKKLTVNCLLDEKPEGWRDGWDISSVDFDTEEEYTHFEVVWGYKAD